VVQIHSPRPFYPEFNKFVLFSLKRLKGILVAKVATH
jgi:hypothetical protein